MDVPQPSRRQSMTTIASLATPERLISQVRGRTGAKQNGVTATSRGLIAMTVGGERALEGVVDAEEAFGYTRDIVRWHVSGR